MARTLKEAFPIIRDRIEVRVEIEKREEPQKIFYGWSEERQTEFLDFCTGVRGIKFLYDSFFKEILNPEYTPERLEELLTLLLGIPVKILEALPADSTRIADESSLLIMDIVVQLGNGSIVNLEVQKIGYKFPLAQCLLFRGSAPAPIQARTQPGQQAKTDVQLQGYQGSLYDRSV